MISSFSYYKSRYVPFQFECVISVRLWAVVGYGFFVCLSHLFVCVCVCMCVLHVRFI